MRGLSHIINLFLNRGRSEEGSPKRPKVHRVLDPHEGVKHRVKDPQKKKEVL